MKFLVSLTALLLSTSAWASNTGYQLDMELSVNGQTLSSPSLIVEAGKMGEVIQERSDDLTYLEVTADPANEGELQNGEYIRMKFKISYMLKDGSRKVVAEPIILAASGEGSQIAVGDFKGDELALRIVATKIEL